MPTNFKFSSYIDIGSIPGPAKSVGAHVAAKLELFNSDERTLTDELCDMLCIWLGKEGKFLDTSHGSQSFKFTLGKTTVSEEAFNGADLELIVSSPLGVKRCLIQAKVFDPNTQKLRCDSKTGWENLRNQLLSARNIVGELAFLLIYVPGGLLNKKRYGFNTYEQGADYETSSSIPSYYGATLIPVDKLLDPAGNWIDGQKKVSKLHSGRFKHGIAFWRVLIELLICRRSTWKNNKEAKLTDRMHASRKLSLGVSEISEKDWKTIQLISGELLTPEEEDDDSFE
ncbi:hypothetical protein [Methylophilus sp. QUAN]|uniref:hypothetical protein n=1 Tax=Methylophilus sp. QUAN TaxID=2781020 RepID=UPI001890059F|nr:hypothetical protein [Methylophilus sp. QUAN]MBF4991858.1 hypothetical protein [Methylophilus sp. QUAN]